MKAFYPIAYLSNMLGGWFLANHWTHNTPLWWAAPFLLLGTFCLWVSVFKPTFPPFKSMYLLRGTLNFLAVWLVSIPILLYFLAGAKGRAMWDYPVVMVGTLVVGLFISPLAGWVHAILTRQEDRIRALITDDQLKDYERHTLSQLRAFNPWLKHAPTKVLVAAWHDWSTKTYCAGWIDSTSPGRIEAFVKWAFTRPIDRY